MKDINELIYEELQMLRKDTRDGFTLMNGRVRDVENFQNKQKGVMLAGGSLVTFFSWLASYFGGGHHS